MESKEKNILILGSGMMVEPLIDYLLKRKENKITIASDIYEIAKSISDKKSRCFPEKIDVVNDESKLGELVKSHDLVISFIPAFLHMYVAIKCLEHNKNMVTASYISDEMKALNDKVKEKKLIFMNEIGLDPGIDHVVAHKVIDDCKEDNSKIISYESWCGALPSPDAIDNPLLYKFSWSPRGALNAMKNSVVFLQDGEEKEIMEENVLLSTVEKNFHNCFQFEGYYNRNSVKYREIYELKDVKTLIRGTIRFKGFCFIIQCFKIFGLFNSTDIVKEDIPWRSYFEQFFSSNSERIGQTFKTWGANFQIRIYGLNEEDNEFYRKIVFYAISYINEEYLQKNDVNKLCSNFAEMIHFLNFNDRSNILKKNKTNLDNFANLLEEKLKLQPWEKDLVFMQNSFIIQKNDGRKVLKNYNLVLFGNHNNLPYSATSLTVAYPAAIAAQLILDNEIKEYGVLMPSNPLLCKKIISELGDNKIFMREEIHYFN